MAHFIEIILPYLKKYLAHLLVGSTLILLSSILIFPTPLITKHLIDDILPSKNVNALIVWAAILLVIHIAIKVIIYSQNLIFLRINNKIKFDIRLSLIKHINKLKIKHLKEFNTGYLMARIDDDTNRIQSLFADTFIVVFKEILTFAVGLAGLFYINYKLTLIIISILPIYIYLTIYYTKIIRKESAINFEDIAYRKQSLEEALNMIELGRLFSRENFNILRYFHKAKISYKSTISVIELRMVNNLFIGILLGFSPLIIILFGGYEITCDKFTVGELIAFSSFVGYIISPTGIIINININIQNGLIALDRISNMFDLETESSSCRKKKLKKNNRDMVIKNLSFKSISFKYSTNRKIFRDVSLEIKMGERIAFVGCSGSGKTTLFRLLTGLYELSDGEIFINNKALKYSDIINLRKQISIVEQEPLLFNDTIYNNIKFGSNNVNRDDVLLAANQSNILEFTNKLDRGYDTLVGDKGCNLSVGQRQRIAFARALIKKPKILILDEATSSIDNFNQQYISDTIKNLPNNMIVLIAAHRLSTIKNCDMIYVIDNGTICESGSHEELLEKKR